MYDGEYEPRVVRAPAASETVPSTFAATFASHDVAKRRGKTCVRVKRGVRGGITAFCRRPRTTLIVRLFCFEFIAFANTASI